MRFWTIFAVFAAGALAGCMAAGPPLPAQTSQRTGAKTPLGMPLSERRSIHEGPCVPLILDRTDLRIGTTVHFSHVPTASELHDAEQVPLLQHVVLSLSEWPTDIAAMSALNNVPEETDVIVVLAGYPPSRAAAEAWNYTSPRLRLVLVVTEPPRGPAVVDDLNTMRHLERVIADLDEPARTGFERLQMPLSFRKVMD